MYSPCVWEIEVHCVVVQGDYMCLVRPQDEERKMKTGCHALFSEGAASWAPGYKVPSSCRLDTGCYQLENEAFNLLVHLVVMAWVELRALFHKNVYTAWLHVEPVSEIWRIPVLRLLTVTPLGRSLERDTRLH